MRVLFVYESISSIGGGSQIAILTWMKNLLKMGIEIKLLSNEGSYIDKTIINRVIFNKAYDMSCVFPQYYLSLGLSNEAKQEIKKFRPQIIHLNELSFSLNQIIKFAKLNKIKIVASYHTDYKKSVISSFPHSLFIHKGGLFNKILTRFQSQIMKDADCIISPSLFYQSQLKNQFNKKIFCVPYPITNDFFQKNRTVPIKISKLLTISRLSGEKHIEILIDAVALLKNKFSLTIVGEGVDRKTLEDKTKKLGLEKIVKFAGWVKHEDLPRLLKNHHLYVSPSDFETFGISYIEALASQIPCVVYDFPVSREVIPNNMAVFIKSLDPKQWANELLKLQNNRNIYQRLKQNISKNYQDVFRYNERESSLKLLEVYKKIL